MKITKELLKALALVDTGWWLKNVGEDFPIDRLKDIKGDYHNIVSDIRSVLNHNIFNLEDYILVFEYNNEEYTNKYDSKWNCIENNHPIQRYKKEYNDNGDIIRCDFGQVDIIHPKKWYNIFSNKRCTVNPTNDKYGIKPKGDFQNAYTIEYNNDNIPTTKRYSDGRIIHTLFDSYGIDIGWESFKDSKLIAYKYKHYNSEGLVEMLISPFLVGEYTYHDNKNIKTFKRNKDIWICNEDGKNIHSIKEDGKFFICKYNGEGNMIYNNMNNELIDKYTYIYNDKHIHIKHEQVNISNPESNTTKNCIIPMDWKNQNILSKD